MLKTDTGESICAQTVPQTSKLCRLVKRIRPEIHDSRLPEHNCTHLDIFLYPGTMCCKVTSNQLKPIHSSTNNLAVGKCVSSRTLLHPCGFVPF